MMDDDKLNALILRIYDAALDDAQWPSLVHELAKLVSAEDSLLFGSPDVGNNRMMVLSPTVNSYGNDTADAYEAYYWQHDVWKAKAAERGLTYSGAIFHGDQFIERAAFRKTEIYSDFFKPMMNSTGVVLTSVIEEATLSQPMPLVLSFYKSLHAEAFTQHDEQLIRQLMPHLQRSLRIRRKMIEERQMRQLREHALDQSKDAILLLDATGWILFANRKAEMMLRQGNPIIRQGRLHSQNIQENKALLNALHKAQAGIGSALKFGINHSSAGRVAMFSPIQAARSEQLDIFAHVMVIITEPDKSIDGNLGSFAKLYGLTAAEARILQYLLHQLSTKEIAELLDISINTLRTHLKALFAKTHTRNQRELVQFCLSHPINT